MLFILIVTTTISLINFANLVQIKDYSVTNININKNFPANKTAKYVIIAKSNVNVELIDLTKCTNFYEKNSTLKIFNMIYGENSFYLLARTCFWFSIAFCFVMQMFTIRQKRMKKNINKEVKYLVYVVKILYIPGTFAFSLIDCNGYCVKLNYSNFIMSLVCYGNIALIVTLGVAIFLLINFLNNDNEEIGNCCTYFSFFCALIMVILGVILHAVSFLGTIVDVIQSLLSSFNIFLTIENFSKCFCFCSNSN